MNDQTDRPPARILLADDEPLYLQATSQLLRKAGYDCECVADADAAIAVLRDRPVDLVLTDLNMPGNLKLELLQAGREHFPRVPLVVVTGVPSLPTAIESVRLGIADYLIKPVKFEVLLKSIERTLAAKRAAAASDDSELAGDLPEVIASDPQIHGIIGSSEPIRNLLEMITRVAASDSNVLISGESGTGKELVAAAIHRISHRRDFPLQIIDCTAIPETLFESLLFGHVKGSFTGATDDRQGLLQRSDGGTAFFDEIGELPMTLQPKLLRVIQEQTFVPVGKSQATQLNTRFISATNRNLLKEVEAGRFRRDLFYRLSVLHLELPPLRSRGDDVIQLAQHFLQTLRTVNPHVEGFTDDCLERLRQYRWPGNIRELRNAVESALALCTTRRIDVADLPDWIADDQAIIDETSFSPPAGVIAMSRSEARGSIDRSYVEALLREYRGNISGAARHAGLSRQSLHKLLNKYEISAARFREQR